MSALCGGILTVYSVAVEPLTVTFSVEKLGSVSGCGSLSNLKLTSTSVVAADPVKVISHQMGMIVDIYRHFH